jgi:lysophospholipase L1-like esterase
MRRIVAIAVLLAAWAAAAKEPFYLKPGDRVVFYGDSITDQRLYTTFTETYVVTRFPKLKVSFVHSGWGGDRVTGGGGGGIDVRLKRDVFAYRPTVMTIMLGMNDGSYQAFDDRIFENYAKGYRHIIEAMKRAVPAVRITVIQPSPFDDVTRPPTFSPGYNAVLVRYGQFVAGLAGSNGVTVADLNTPLVEALRKANAADPERAKDIIRDRVHPGPGGHLLMAEALLKSWNAPAEVSSAAIDAAGPRVVSASGAVISGLKREGGGLSWVEADAALPMPFDRKDAALALAVQSSDFVEAMDQQPLKVSGLEAARYALSIDGQRIAAFSREELAAGVNLATLATPMMAQAAAVHDLTLKHNTVHFACWRQVEVPLEQTALKSRKAARAALDRLEAELIAAQRAAAQPKPHRFALTPEPR